MRFVAVSARVSSVAARSASVLSPMRELDPWRRLPFVGCLLATLASSPAFGQSAEANLLFDEARAAMAQHDYERAIVKLQQSQSLDPSPGTLLNLAECYVAVGRTASAWSAYRDAASLAYGSRQPEREHYAARRAQELEPQLSKLEVTVVPEARVRGLEISRNGVPVPEALWGTPIPVDPGAQHVEARAAGYVSWTADVSVPAGPGKTPLQVPVLVEQSPPPVAPPPAPTAPAVPVAATSPASPVGTDVARSNGFSPLPIIGWSTIGAGAVATGVGVVVYLNGRGKIDDANCPDQICVRGVGNKSLHDSGRSGERLGIGLGVVGVAAAATGVVLLLVAPKSSEQRALELRLNWAGRGVGVAGTW
jgi:hypothetical protein